MNRQLRNIFKALASPKSSSTLYSIEPCKIKCQTNPLNPHQSKQACPVCQKRTSRLIQRPPYQQLQATRHRAVLFAPNPQIIDQASEPIGILTNGYGCMPPPTHRIPHSPKGLAPPESQRSEFQPIAHHRPDHKQPERGGNNMLDGISSGYSLRLRGTRDLRPWSDKSSGTVGFRICFGSLVDIFGLEVLRPISMRQRTSLAQCNFVRLCAARD